MSINGVRILENTKYSIFYIETFSSEFKQIIRTQLQGIWSGFAEADSLPEFYSYKNTLTWFLERYEPKSENTRKGMIGELLSHVLLNHQDNNLTSLSILKNKEEKSIKKGFDIIYCHIDDNKLWYSEAKSGRSEDGTSNSTDYNIILLNRAKSSIEALIDERRNSLWESALYDVSAMINENNGRLNFRQLLSNDSPSLNSNQKKNVILISILYHNLSDNIEENSVIEFLEKTILEDIFEDVIIISIQKNTFEVVANFLRDELNTN
ncbi:Hachiman antiphage defense system protein HamA [uncultured Draconibacterium sp.]|uniref:Hachiman antiphage defense system protein HamA n=1 Tax=uncultured Draconibacterium sp. TaxID=1573823 RepID=UPI003216AC88